MLHLHANWGCAIVSVFRGSTGKKYAGVVIPILCLEALVGLGCRKIIFVLHVSNAGE
ncbi:MAG: hypothetical protein PWQ49_138 [Methanohalophilus sp.]|nr:hypothetical protein [Methanohalophilus sp.]